MKRTPRHLPAAALVAFAMVASSGCASDSNDANRTAIQSDVAASSTTVALPAPPQPRASAAAAVASANAPAPPPPAVDAAPAAYPEEAIERAQKASGYDCQKLVYKRGCAEIRTGRIKVRVSLAADGSVSNVEVLENAIVRDPKLVEQCVVDSLRKWKLDPSISAAPTFEKTFVFSDKC